METGILKDIRAGMKTVEVKIGEFIASDNNRPLFFIKDYNVFTDGKGHTVINIRFGGETGQRCHLLLSTDYFLAIVTQKIPDNGMLQMSFSSSVVPFPVLVSLVPKFTIF